MFLQENLTLHKKEWLYVTIKIMSLFENSNYFTKGIAKGITPVLVLKNKCVLILKKSHALRKWDNNNYYTH